METRAKDATEWRISRGKLPQNKSSTTIQPGILFKYFWLPIRAMFLRSLLSTSSPAFIIPLVIFNTRSRGRRGVSKAIAALLERNAGRNNKKYDILEFVYFEDGTWDMCVGSNKLRGNFPVSLASSCRHRARIFSLIDHAAETHRP